MDTVVLWTRRPLVLLRGERRFHQERVQSLRSQKKSWQVYVKIHLSSEAYKMILRTVPPAEEEVDDPKY